jgi:hypothetical protein
MDHAVMPCSVLGERERFPDHPPDLLAQGVVPALHMRCLASLLADTQVLRFGKDAGVGLPEVAEGAATAVGFGYSAPKFPAGRLAPVAVDVGHYLPRPATKRRPRPHLVAPFLDIAAHFVKFQDIIRLRLGQAVSHLRQPPEFFLARRLRWVATRRKPAKCPAGWRVPGTPAGFPPCAPRCTGRLAPAPCKHHSPCNDTAACRSHCARS